MSNKETRPRIRFKYIFESNYNPIFTNGTYGGVTPQGQIVANFFFERNPIPYSEEREIMEDGKLSEPIISEPDNGGIVVVRYVNNGIIFTLEHAKIFNKWLAEKIKVLEKMQAKQPKKSRKRKS